MTHLLFIAFSCRLMGLVPVAGPEVVTSTNETAQSIEPIADLPSIPSPQIDSITLFPNRSEIVGGAGFNDQRFGYVLHGEVSASYESNIFIQPHDAQSDFIFRIAPGAAVGWGEFRSEIYGPNSFRHQFERYVGKNYLYLDYSPSYTWFADHTDQDKFDQDIRLVGELTLNRLTLGVQARYLTQNVPEEDIGTRVEQRRITAALTSEYAYSGKTTFEVDARFDSVDYDGNYIDTREWRNEDWLNYQISPKIKAGLGGAIGYVDQSEGPSQTYQRALVRFKYEATDKLTVGLSGGFEFRQTEDADDRTNGIFQFDLSWTPTDGAYFYLSAFRRAVSAGNFGSDYYYATGAQLQYRQRLFHAFFFSLSTGYQNADYQTQTAGGDFGRNDNLYFVRPGIGFDLTTWVNCEITGEYRKNDSTVDARSFDSTIATVRVNVLF